MQKKGASKAAKASAKPIAAKSESGSQVRSESKPARPAKAASSSKFPAEDDRFAAVRNDPRFRMPKSKDEDGGGGKKVVVDERFSAMFTDDEFKNSRAKIDKYGRKTKATKQQGGLGDLSRHYVLSEAEQERLEQLNRVARGEADDDEASSSSSSDDSEEEENAAEVEAGQDEPLLAAELGEDSSKRLAVVGCDWDHLRAVDIFAMLKSFTPPGGAVIEVAVYSSEFGRQRMQQEEVNGPFSNGKEAAPDNEDDEDEDEDEDEGMTHEAGSGYNPELLRKYGKERLLYYFAVVTCDSIATAEALYRECDGVEFEHSSVTMDLRFVPDDVQFDASTLRDRASDVPEAYAPADFVSKPLQSTEVDLAWDEPAFDRRKLMRWGALGGGKKKAEEAIPMDELEAFIASEDDEGEDSDDEREKRQQDVERYRALLGKGASKHGKDESKEDEEKEDTFFVGEEKYGESEGESSAADEEESEDEDKRPMPSKFARNPKLFVAESQLEEDDEEDVRNKKKGATKKEKRKMKKEEKKRAGEPAGDADIDVKDERFAPLFTEPEYALDRTDPRFKLTNTAKKIEEERRKRLRKDA